MWSTSVSFTTFNESSRWNVEYFCTPQAAEAGRSGFPMRPIGSLVTERKGSIDPRDLGHELINYLSLEHIRSLTGQLVGFEKRPASTVRSRSKVFFNDDVLYGRLRPNLNKVYHATGPVAEGVCSGEFFVFIPDTTVIYPIVLRYLLSSKYVTRHADQFQIGTALPRMNLDDLLTLKVPVPPLSIQAAYAATLKSSFLQLVELTAQVEVLPQRLVDSFQTALELGAEQIP